MHLVLRKYSESLVRGSAGKAVKSSDLPAKSARWNAWTGPDRWLPDHGWLTGRARALCIAAALGALALASCGEEDERRPVASSQASAPQEAAKEGVGPSAARIVTARGAGSREWLDMGDDTAPEVFLATRAMPKGAPPASPQAVAEIAALLAEADAVFDENRRMLANRTLQLKRMLDEMSVDESPQMLLGGFITVGRAVGRIGYSDLCQHYFNLRAGGLSREEAIAALAAPAAERRTR